MERTAWTDERLDDLSRRMDAGFERVDRDVRDLRAEMRAEFADVRMEMRNGFGEVRAEFASMRTLIYRFGGAMLVTFGGAIVSLAVRGG
jgi:hypothetical protein